MRGGWVHRGTVEAAAFWIDPRLTGEGETLRRILALWQPGGSVFRLGRGYLVRLPRALGCDTRTAPGLPLSRQGDVLVGFPLPPAVLERLAPPRGAVVFYRAGALAVDLPEERERVDPSAWLDVSPWCEVEVASLGAPPPPPAVEAPVPAAFEARRALALPEAAPGLAEVLAALRETPGSPSGRSWLGRLAALWRGGRRRAAPHRAPGEAGQGVAAAAPPPPSRLALSVYHLFSGLWRSSRLAFLFGRRHAAYIRRMMELFDRGDYTEALRHAIPLSSEVGASLARIAWRLPRPRQSLSIGLASHAGPSVFLEGDLFGRLQQLYREAFERLAAEGRIEEATFVLAEVLQAHAEAVAFLERHGRLRLAAELAEARGLPAAQVVRQWFLAGDRRRALEVARRRGAFDVAAALLEKTGRSLEAKAFRLLWGGELAAAGAYAAAFEAVAPVEEGRALAETWMARAVELGGEAGARTLARGLAWGGEREAFLRERALALLQGEGPEGSAARLAFAQALQTAERTPETTALARAAARAVLRDAGSPGGAARSLTRAELRALVAFSGDGALKADLRPPLLPRPRSWDAEDGRAVGLDLPAADTGTRAIHDAAFLPDGRLIVALGEAGVLLLTRDGRRVAHFDAPAHRLVVSDHGDRAIACARRGETWSLARLDFAGRRAKPWTAARLSAFAESYDGDLWFVASPDGLAAIETREPRFVASWAVPEARDLLALSRDAARCSLLAGRPLQRWTYELPSLTLRERDDVAAKRGDMPDTCYAVSAEGRVADAGVVLLPDDPDREFLRLSLSDREPPLSIPLPVGASAEAAEIRRTADWLAAAAVGGEGSHVFLARGDGFLPAATLFLGRARQPTLRLDGRTLTLTVADELGRLLVIDLASGTVLRNLRV